MAADKAEKSTKILERRSTPEESPERNDGDVIVLQRPQGMPSSPESPREVNTITLALRNP